MRMNLWEDPEHFWKPRGKQCDSLVGCIWGKNRSPARAKGSCSQAALPPLTKDNPRCQTHPTSTLLLPNWGRADLKQRWLGGSEHCSPRVHTLHQLPPGSHALARTPWGGKGPFCPLCWHAAGRRHRCWHFSVWLPGCSRHFHLGKYWPAASIWPDECSAGKSLPQERLFFPHAPRRWAGSLPAPSCAHPATSRLEEHRSGWLLWGGSRGKMLERQLLAAGGEQPAPWKVQPACRERHDWATKGKREQTERLQRLGKRVETSREHHGMSTGLQAGGASPDALPKGWF